MTVQRFARAAIVAATCAITPTIVSAQAQPPAAPVPATPQNAAAFVGDWDVAAGDASMSVAIKTADGQLTAEITAQTGTHKATALVQGTSLILSYNFDYQGMGIDGVVTLTPNPQTRAVDAYMDFAGGAAQFSGIATKKAAK